MFSQFKNKVNYHYVSLVNMEEDADGQLLFYIYEKKSALVYQC